MYWETIVVEARLLTILGIFTISPGASFIVFSPKWKVSDYMCRHSKVNKMFQTFFFRLYSGLLGLFHGLASVVLFCLVVFEICDIGYELK